MHKLDIQYLRSKKYHFNTSFMHNYKSNFVRFFNITKSVFKNRINSFNNFFLCQNKPNMTESQIIVFAITGESFGIDSECFL